MGKQQRAAAAMSAPPPRKRKKKGRPSLLDLQKRSLRLEGKLQEPAAPARPSTRRNPAPSGSADDSDGPASGGRREKKLRLVMGLHDESAKGEKTRKATDGHEEPSDSGPTTPLPNKKLLLFVLDRLQKKDTYGVFSEPVDPEELPDYFDIVKHPMDFSTVRKKLDKGAYSNLEQFEDDVFLISTNAMSYNSPDTIYYRQARGIQEMAKKDFENLRQDSDASESEPEREPEAEPEPEPEQKPQPRRGRPPNKNNVKQKVGRPPAERANADVSGATLATAANIGRHTQSELDLSRRVMDTLRASFANQKNMQNWSVERKSERVEDHPGHGSNWSARTGKKPLLMEDSRRTTYYESQPSSSIYELPGSTSYNGTRKLLVPVGVQLQQSYSRSLARFAAQLGPVGWEIASRRIERSLPAGTKFGRGWVGDEEAPSTFQPPSLPSFSEANPPPSNNAAPGEQPTVKSPATTDCAASASHLVGSQPHASTSTAQRIDSRTFPTQQCGSIPHVSMDRGEHSVEMKGNQNHHEHPVMQQTFNGFNAAPGPMIFPSTAPLVVNQMQMHTRLSSE